MGTVRGIRSIPGEDRATAGEIRVTKPSWKVVCIELAEPLTALHGVDTHSGLWVIFFWQGVPLGHCEIASEQLPLSSTQLSAMAAQAISEAAGDSLLEEGFHSALPRMPDPKLRNPVGALASLADLDRPLALLDRKLQAAVPASRQTVSVAVCTRERPNDLARCLESLSHLREQPHEILVIDNAPQSEATREVVMKYPHVTYCVEPRVGLSHARNKALDIAKGDIVAFTDDDVQVHPDWLTRLRPCFDDPKVMVATGLVLPAELETPAQLMFERSFQFFHQGYRRRCFDSTFFNALKAEGVPAWSIGAGANMAIRRQFRYRFDPCLGPGIFGGCGEDSEFWYRVLAEGWSCVYEPSACVFHYHRRELSALRNLIHQYMKGHVAALILQFAKFGHFGNLRRLFLRLPAEYAILMLRLVVTGFSLDNRILLRGSLGCLSGLRFALTRKQA
jgi:glycosyltransferase involved in cell wall biosynthesis